MTVVKICGITGVEHGLGALESGADLLGFVFASSKRRVEPERAARMIEACRRTFPPARRPWLAIGVFANQPREFVQAAASVATLDVIQLSGAEPPDYCRQIGLPLYRAVHVPSLLGTLALPDQDRVGERLRALQEECGAARLLLDSGGAGRWGCTGEAFGWEEIGAAAAECLVAGGLNPGNVVAALAAMAPWGVDVSSGVERDGTKAQDLIRRFITEVRRWDDAHDAR